MRRDVNMAKETTLIKKGISNFKIVGKVIKNDYTFDLDKQSQKSDYIYSQMRLNIKTKHGNIKKELKRAGIRFLVFSLFQFLFLVLFYVLPVFLIPGCVYFAHSIKK